MRQVAGAAALFAMVAGCGGQSMTAPSQTPLQSSTSTTALAHAQGVLCDFNGSATQDARCATAGGTSRAATVLFRVPQGGTIHLSLLTRPLFYEEYTFFWLTCDGNDNHVTAMSGKAAPQPDWFTTVPGITSATNAQDSEYTVDTPVAPNASCQVTLSFDLEYDRPPYTPYDLTIAIEKP